VSERVSDRANERASEQASERAIVIVIKLQLPITGTTAEGEAISSMFSCFMSCLAGVRTYPSTTASLSAPPAADSYRLPASKHVCYNVRITTTRLGDWVLLLQDSNCGTVSQQNATEVTTSWRYINKFNNNNIIIIRPTVSLLLLLS